MVNKVEFSRSENFPVGDAIVVDRRPADAWGDYEMCLLCDGTLVVVGGDGSPWPGREEIPALDTRRGYTTNADAVDQNLRFWSAHYHSALVVRFPGPYPEEFTALEIEQANPGLRVALLPLAEAAVRCGRSAVVIAILPDGEKYIHFDNHPSVRQTRFGELIYLADHAGRAIAGGATHVAVQDGTRLHAILTQAHLLYATA